MSNTSSLTFRHSNGQLMETVAKCTLVDEFGECMNNRDIPQLDDIDITSHTHAQSRVANNNNNNNNNKHWKQKSGDTVKEISQWAQQVTVSADIVNAADWDDSTTIDSLAIMSATRKHPAQKTTLNTTEPSIFNGLFGYLMVLAAWWVMAVVESFLPGHTLEQSILCLLSIAQYRTSNFMVYACTAVSFMLTLSAMMQWTSSYATLDGIVVLAQFTLYMMVLCKQVAFTSLKHPTINVDMLPPKVIASVILLFVDVVVVGVRSDSLLLTTSPTNDSIAVLITYTFNTTLRISVALMLISIPINELRMGFLKSLCRARNVYSILAHVWNIYGTVCLSLNFLLTVHLDSVQLKKLQMSRWMRYKTFLCTWIYRALINDDTYVGVKPKEPEEPSLTLKKKSRLSDAEKSFPVSHKDLHFSNSHVIDGRFELCVDSIGSTYIILSWSTPRSLLYSLALNETLVAKKNVQHVLATNTTVHGKDLSKNQITERAVTDIEGEFDLKFMDLRVLLDYKECTQIKILWDKKRLKIEGLDSGRAYVVQLCLRKYTSVPLLFYTEYREGIFIMRIILKFLDAKIAASASFIEQEQFREHVLRRTDSTVQIDAEKSLRKVSASLLKKMKKEHSKHASQVKSSLEDAKRANVRAESAYQKAVQRVNALPDQIVVIQRQIEDLDKETSVTKEQCENLQLKVVEFRQSSQEQKERLDTVFDRMNAQIAMHEFEILECGASLDNKRHAYTELTRELSALEKECSRQISEAATTDALIKKERRRHVVLQRKFNEGFNCESVTANLLAAQVQLQTVTGAHPDMSEKLRVVRAELESFVKK